MDAVIRVLETAELISTIFSFLKQETGKWKGDAARLAIVNRSFFHAAIAIVWEDMDSFEPFCSILVPSKVPSAPTAFNQEAWGRFDLYSTKTKTLVLNSPTSLSNNSCWTFLMGTSNPTQGKLLPSLKTLCLNSADPLSLSIAFSVCPYIKTLSIHLHPQSAPDTKEAILALTMALSRQARSLVTVQLVYPLQIQSLGNLLAIKSLRDVKVFMTNADHQAVTPSFWAPVSLAVGESFGPMPDAAYITTRDILQRVPFSGPPGPRRTLLVKGGSRLHDMLANHPCAPTPSQRFDGVYLKLNSDGSMAGELLTAFTIAKFISRNPNLSLLKVSGRNRTLHGHGLARIRASPGFRNTDLLITQLAASRNLTLIKIEGIYFPSGNIIHRMLDVLQGSPHLTIFRFLPVALSNASIDALTGPSMSCLDAISTQCSKLIELAIPVNLWEYTPTPSPPTSFWRRPHCASFTLLRFLAPCRSTR